MPGKKKLQEEYTKIDQQEVEKEIEKAEEAVKKKQNEIFKFRLRKFRNDVIYILILSAILGFILWVWKTSVFTFWKSLSLGLAWYLLFDDLKLHRLFKQQ